MPKVFLSFATEDLDFVNKIFSRLKRLGVDIWDYSNRNEEILLGAVIREYLADRIQQSDYFIPVVSYNSVPITKTCIQFEVRHAAEQHKKCFPIIISTRRPNSWTGAFELISDRKYMEMDHEDDIKFEERICDLCGDLKVMYEPDIVDANRLPLYKKLQIEISYKLKVIKEAGDRYIHEKLMKLVNKFNLAYSNGQWDKSLEVINYVLSFSKDELDNSVFYYPLIVKGTCELQLGLIDAAENTFIEAVNSPDVDENAYGGMGAVYYRQNKLDEALKQYLLAQKKCPGGEDTAILYNILLTAYEMLSNEAHTALQQSAKSIIDNPEYIQKLNAGKFNHKERQRIKLLLGLIYFKTGKFDNAYDNLSAVYYNEIFCIKTEEIDYDLHLLFSQHGFFIPKRLPLFRLAEDRWLLYDGESIYFLHSVGGVILIYYRELSLIIYFSQLLVLLKDVSEALRILRTEAEYLQNRLIYQYYASLLIDNKLITEACNVYSKQLCSPPYDRQHLVDFALILKCVGPEAKMTENCELVTNLGIPMDRKENYYHGFAYYLLGKKDTADVFYKNSENYGAYYSSMI